MRFEQSIIHKEYLEHIFDKFSYLGTKNVSIKLANRKLFNTSSVYFTSRQLTAITELYTLFYHEGRKIVPFNPPLIMWRMLLIENIDSLNYLY